MKVRLTESYMKPDEIEMFIIRHPSFIRDGKNPNKVYMDLTTQERLFFIQMKNGKWVWRVEYESKVSERSSEKSDTLEKALMNFVEVSGLVRPIEFQGFGL